MSKKAIVTGATGFVGSNLCRRLLEENWKVSTITRESSNYSNLEDILESINVYVYSDNILSLINYFNKEDADVVFHLASLFIAEHKSYQIDALVESNLRFGVHILEAMKESNTKLMINTGTSWQHYYTDEYNPVDLYAATKESFKKIIKYYIEAEGIRAITLKLFDTYGETDKRPKLINLLNQFANDQKELKMSPGEQVLDLVHVNDVANAFLKAYDYLKKRDDVKYDEFGVGSGNEIKLIDLIKTFEQQTGKKINVVWGGREYRKREVMRLWRKYKILPNWRANICLKEGLKRLSNLSPNE